MNTLAAINTAPQEPQMDLFKKFHGLYDNRSQTKVKDCLDCGKVKMTMNYDTSEGIYVGKRVCYNCSGKQKRKFFTI